MTNGRSARGTVTLTYLTIGETFLAIFNDAVVTEEPNLPSSKRRAHF
jgi:hypothetical protein